jgi:hypothetical protein
MMICCKSCDYDFETDEDITEFLGEQVPPINPKLVKMLMRYYGFEMKAVSKDTLNIQAIMKVDVNMSVPYTIMNFFTKNVS